uniref:Uncharacterized protein n=1 Tax=viral metagenome TaxID=1070528 RepID=A0A6C0I0B2_9ZZZZ
MPLRIGELIIEKLSGPKIVCLAVPKENIPMLLLLGEEHSKVTTGCDGVNVKQQFDNLLQKLNSIGEHEEIHFFSEWFFQEYHNKKIAELESLGNSNFITRYSSNSELANYIERNNEFCYFNELKKKDIARFLRKCKYPNIIWQFSDIRKKNDENNIFQVITLFDNAITELIKRLIQCSSIGEEEVRTKSEFYKKMRNEKCGKKESHELTDINIYEKIKDYFDKFELENDNYLEDDGDYEYIKINTDELIENIQYLFDFYNRDFDKIINKIMNIKRIKKQIKKLTNRIKIKSTSRKSVKKIHFSRNSKSKNSMKKKMINFELYRIIYNYLNNLSQKYNKKFKENIDLYFPLLEKIIIFLKNGKSFEDFKEIMVYIESHGLLINKNMKKYGRFFLFTPPFSVLLDIYLILRSFKYKNAKLVVSLVGYNHVLNMIDFFKSNSELYDIYVFDNDNEDYAKKIEGIEGDLNNQCINLNRAFNINDELIDFDMSILQ